MMKFGPYAKVPLLPLSPASPTAGLKGFAIGEAGVSIKHANFIVNKGQAQAADVLELIRHIQKVVSEKTGVALETEVVIAGDW